MKINILIIVALITTSLHFGNEGIIIKKNDEMKSVKVGEMNIPSKKQKNPGYMQS